MDNETYNGPTYSAESKSPVLRWTGVILLILGIVEFISAVYIYVLNGSVISSAMDAATQGSGLSGNMLLVIMAAISFILCAIMIIAGLLGILKANRPGRPISCIVFGVLCVAMQILSLSNGTSGMGMITLALHVIFLVTAVLYTVGAIIKK